MSIAAYIKEIGRGKDGARPLTADQAHDLLDKVFSGQVTDLEIGAFCLAMRIKGETAQEMAGFLDATHQRLHSLPASTGRPTIVIPSYNGARKLPVLTPLLALLLAREGLAVLEQAHQRHPDDTDILLALATASLQQGDRDRALRYTQALARLAPNDPNVRRLQDAIGPVGP